MHENTLPRWMQNVRSFAEHLDPVMRDRAFMLMAIARKYVPDHSSLPICHTEEDGLVCMEFHYHHSKKVEFIYAPDGNIEVFVCGHANDETEMAYGLLSEMENHVTKVFAKD